MAPYSIGLCWEPLVVTPYIPSASREPPLVAPYSKWLCEDSLVVAPYIPSEGREPLVVDH